MKNKLLYSLLFLFSLFVRLDLKAQIGNSCEQPDILTSGSQTFTIQSYMNYFHRLVATDNNQIKIDIGSNELFNQGYLPLKIRKNCNDYNQYPISIIDKTVTFYALKGDSLIIEWNNSNYDSLQVNINTQINTGTAPIGYWCSNAVQLTNGVNYTNPDLTNEWYSITNSESGFYKIITSKYTNQYYNIKIYDSCNAEYPSTYINTNDMNSYFQIDAENTLFLTWDDSYGGKPDKFDIVFSKTNEANIYSFKTEYLTKKPIINDTSKTIELEISLNADITQAYCYYEISPGAKLFFNGEEQYSGSSFNLSDTLIFTVMSYDSTSVSDWKIITKQATELSTSNDLINISLTNQINYNRKNDSIFITLTENSSSCQNVTFEISPLAKLYDDGYNEFYNNYSYCFNINTYTTWFVEAENGTKREIVLYVTQPIEKGRCENPIGTQIGIINSTIPMNQNDIWYEFIPMEDGILSVSTCNTNAPESIGYSIMKDCSIPTIFSSEACNNNKVIIKTSVFQGHKYLINLYDNNLSSNINFDWELTFSIPNPGTECISAVDAIKGTNVSTTDNNNIFWNKYTAQINGIIEVSTCNMNNTSNIYLDVLTDCENNYEFTYQPCETGQGTWSFKSEKDKVYYLRWGSFNSNVKINWNLIERTPQIGEACDLPLQLYSGINLTINREKKLWTEYTTSHIGKIEIVIKNKYLIMPMYDQIRIVKSCDPSNTTFYYYTDSSIVYYQDALSKNYILWDFFNLTNETESTDIVIYESSEMPPAGLFCSNPIDIQPGLIQNNINQNEIWYKYTPLEDGFVEFNTCPYSISSEIHIYENCPITENDFYNSIYTCNEYNYIPCNSGVPVYIKWDSKITQIADKWDLKFYSNSDISIYNWNFNSQTEPVNIDYSNHTITATVSYNSDLTNLQTHFKLAPDAYIKESENILYSGNSYDYSYNKTITVFAANDTVSQTWEIIVKKASALLSGNEILQFDVLNQLSSKITNNIITVDLPFNAYDCLNINFQLSPLATLYDENNYIMYSANNYCINKFNTPLIWTVKAEDGSIKAWEVVFNKIIPQGATCDNPIAVTQGLNKITNISQGQYELWTTYKVQQNSKLHISTCDLNFSNEAYINAMKNCNDMINDYQSNPCNDGNYEYFFNVNAGEEILIKISNVKEGNIYEFNIKEELPIPGQKCEFPLKGILGENIIAINQNVNEYWIEYTTNVKGFLTFSSCNNPDYIKTSINIMRDCWSSIDDYSNTDCNNGEKTYLQVNPGEFYLIKIFGEFYNITDSSFSINIQERPFMEGESCDLPKDAILGINIANPYSLPIEEYIFKYRAEADGILTLSSCNLTPFDTWVYVARESCSENAIITASDNKCASQSEVTFKCNKDEIYYFVWGNKFPLTFKWQLSYSPSGDLPIGSSCENPIELKSGINNITIEENITWMDFTATKDARIILSSSIKGGEDTELMIFTDCNGTANVEVMYGDTISYFWAQSGISYKMMLFLSQIPENENYIYINEEPGIAPVGSLCSKPIIAKEGVNFTDNSIGYQWFKYVPETDGFLKISSCNYTKDSTIVRIFKSCEDYQNRRDDYNFNYSSNNCWAGSSAESECFAGEEYYIVWENHLSQTSFNWDLNFIPNNATYFIEFGLYEQISNPIINYANSTIEIQIGKTANINYLHPFFKLPPKAKAYIGIDEQFSDQNEIDFSFPVSYTIIAADGISSQKWGIIVTPVTELLSESNIYNIIFDGQVGETTIDTVKKTIDAVIGWQRGTCTNVNSIKQSPLSRIIFDNGQDFYPGYYFCFTPDNTQILTVYAEDGSTSKWSMTLHSQTPPSGFECSNPQIANIGENQIKNGLLYFKFTAPKTGLIELTLTDQYESANVQLFETGCTNLIKDDYINYQNPYVFDVIANNTYIIFFNIGNYKEHNFIMQYIIPNTNADLFGFRLITPDIQIFESEILASTSTININLANSINPSQLMPGFEVSDGAKVLINNIEVYPYNMTMDFSNKSYMRIISQDGLTEKNWTINIYKNIAESGANFLSFEIPNQVQKSNIDTLNNKITVFISEGTDISKLLPFFSISPMASITKNGEYFISGENTIDLTTSQKVTITAENGLSKEWIISAEKLFIPISELYAEPENVVLYVNKSFTPNIKIYPYNASNKNLDIEISDLTLLQKTENGFTAINDGKCYIVFKTKDNSNLTDTIYVNIYKTPVYITELNLPDSIEIPMGMNMSIYPEILPINATEKLLLWNSKDPGIATISQQGLITGNNLGETYIWVESNDLYHITSNFCRVKIIEVAVEDILLNIAGIIELEAGEVTTVKATVLPTNATNQQIYWTSSDKSIFIVDSITGEIKAISKGKATLTGTSVSNNQISNSVEISVTETQVDKSALAIMIDSVVRTISYVTTNNLIGTNTGQYPQTALDSLTKRKEAAEIIIQNTNITQSDVDNTTYMLYKALSTFENTKIGNIKVTSVSILRDTISLNVGGADASLKVTVQPTNATYKKVSFISKNSKVATVDEYGVVHAISSGNTYIIATSKDGTNISDSCFIIVETPVYAIYLPEIVSVKIDNIIQLKPQIIPTNAYIKSLIWLSEDTTIAKVDNYGFIKGIKPGNVNVIVKEAGSGKIAATIVNVTENTISVESIKIIDSISIVVGEETVIIPEFSPKNASNTNISWTTSNDKLVYISENGLVKALSIGSALIYATTEDGNFKDSCMIKINSSYSPIILKQPSITVSNLTDSIVFDLTNIVSDDNTSVSSIVVNLIESFNFKIEKFGKLLIVKPIITNWIGTEKIKLSYIDADGQSTIGYITISMSNAENKAPEIVLMPNQNIQLGGTFNTILLVNKVIDDYTIAERITWNVISSNYLTATIYDNKLEVVPSDAAWIGTDSVLLYAYDKDMLYDSMFVKYSVTDIENTAPYVLSIPTQIQTQDEPFGSIDLKQYVIDDYTLPEYISWQSSASNKFNVNIKEGILSINNIDVNWFGTEILTITAMDESGKYSTGTIVFVQSIPTSSTWEGAISISFNAIKQLVSINEEVQFTSSISGLLGDGNDSWLWTFEGGIPEHTTNMNPSVKYSKPGVYTVKLFAQNKDYSDSLIKVDYIKVFGITQADTTICKGESINLNVNFEDIGSYKWSTNETQTSIAVSPNTSTVYKVTATKGYFEYIDSVEINVAQPLKLQQDTSICFGDTLIINPGIYKNYNWNNSGWNADSSYTNISTLDTITLSVIDDYGCQTSDSLIITEIYALPIVDLGTDTAICNTKEITLNAGIGYNYMWNTGLTTQSITVSDSGIYVVTVTNDKSCISVDSIAIDILKPYAEQIGIATYSDDGKAIVIAWQRTLNRRTNYYELYRETGSVNDWSKIATIPFVDSLYYVDREANAVQQAYRYKLRTYDSTCNNYEESKPHKTMKLTQSPGLNANEANFEWNNYIGMEVSSYKVYLVEPTGLKQIGSVPGGNNEYFAFTYDKHLKENKYRVGFDIPEFGLSQLKTESGPFSQSLSNISEASISKLESKNASIKVDVYPNPATNILYVETENVSEITIKLYNSIGLEVYVHSSIENDIISLDISKLRAGTYQLKVNNPEGECIYQIVVK